MTINTDLLIAAPMLQDYLVDKDSGFPLAGGIITMYKDEARSFLKNWYYQTGTPGAYSYIPLDNPLQLSSVGTIQDPNGNDVIPFYYPFQEDNEDVPESYYVTVYSVDSNGNPAVLQFTRENFPFVGTENAPGLNTPTLRNYIVNNVYWRNSGAQNLTNVTQTVIAPSQHDGYTNGDIQFIKNITGGADAISFLPMTSTVSGDAVTPEFYLNMECTGATTGETQKCIQYPVSLHVATLANVQATFVFDAENVAGNANNYVNIYVYQFLGTGALIQPAPILIKNVVLNNSFTRYSIPFIFPDNTGLTLGSGGDDALFIQVQYPLDSTFNINHTKPSIYLSTYVPDNDFDTYDEISAITDSPRTGDIRTSLNTFNPFGWVAMNDGTLGNTSSNATARAKNDTWPLYNLIWNSFKQFDAGGLNPICQMYTSSAATVAYGSTAIADFNANNALSLTKQMGRVILGTVTLPSLLLQPTYYEAFTTASNVVTTSSSVNVFNGMPVYLEQNSLPIPLNTSTIYYISGFNGTNAFSLSTTFANALAGTIITFGSGSGTFVYAPAGSNQGEYSHAQSIAELAAHNHQSPDAGNFVTSVVAPGTLASGTAGAHVSSSSLTTNTGSSTPFNITQPGTFMNMFMKL